MNIAFFKNNEISGSVDEAINGKLHSSLYGVFILAWAAMHWQLIYTALFVDQALIYSRYHLLRNEYLIHKYFDVRNCMFYVEWIIPFVLTWLVIWMFPKYVALPAFRKDEQYKNSKQKIMLEEQIEIEHTEIELEKSNETKLELTTTNAQKEQQLAKIDPTLTWGKEYEELKKSALYYKLSEIIDAVYDYRGRIKARMINDQYQFEVDQNILVYSDTNGLIDIDNSTPTTTIELTKKGKYFVGRYTSDLSRPPIA